MMCPAGSTHQAHSSMTESSRTRSDSLEASGSQQDRKRPRLDSGQNDGLQSEEALTDSAFPETTQHPDSPEHRPTGSACLSKSSSPSPSKMEPSSNGSLSKVTINTRSAGGNGESQGMKDPAEQSHGISTSIESPSAASTPPGSASGPEMVAAPPDSISIHSSPSRSPEIQIAVVEDIGQDPAETNWTPVTRLTDSALLQEQANPHYVSRTFPYSQQTPAGFVHGILIEIGKIFLQGRLAVDIEWFHADVVFRRRARWIDLHPTQGLARHLPGGSSADHAKTRA
jgi:hypothetical protein